MGTQTSLRLLSLSVSLPSLSMLIQLCSETTLPELSLALNAVPSSITPSLLLVMALMRMALTISWFVTLGVRAMVTRVTSRLAVTTARTNGVSVVSLRSATIPPPTENHDLIFMRKFTYHLSFQNQSEP